MLDKAGILKDVKILVGLKDDSTKDALLSILIDGSVNLIKDLCNDDFTEAVPNDRFPSTLSDVVMEITIARYRKLGFEGKESERLGDYQVAYSVEDIPKSTLYRIYRHRQMRVY